MIVSPSVSLVAAGVASGLCFILFSTLRKGKEADSKRKTKEIVTDDGRCACCLKPFLIGRGVSCNDCGVRSCRKVCSRWDTVDNAWHCLFCHQRRSWTKKKEKWFETFGGTFNEKELHRYFNTAKSRVYVAGVENAATSSGLDLATGGQEDRNTMETVRGFIEQIIEGLIGNVDDTPINRLYDHPEYDRLLATYRVQLADALARLIVSVCFSIANKPSADSPTMAHTALREIVQRAVEEAKKLPGLADSTSDSPKTEGGCNIAEHNYEDLLATAILNKVIEKFQREQIDGNSNVLHEKLSAKAERETELGLDEGVEEGNSSLELFSPDEYRSDCSASCAKHLRNRQEPLSLTIEERIEEVMTTYASDEDLPECDDNGIRITNIRRVPFPELGMDIIDPSQESSDECQNEEETAHVDIVTPFESWEDNWLFQKKRVPIQSDPVAMLVPSSNADFKALIGDKDAEDTSDLSECSSAQSDEEIEKELMEAINNVVPRSPKVSQSEIMENSFNQIEANEIILDDYHFRKSTDEFEQNINSVVIINDERNMEIMADVKSRIGEACNDHIQCEEKFSEKKHTLNETSMTEVTEKSMDAANKEQINSMTQKIDEKLDAGSLEEIESNQAENPKTVIQRTDIVGLEPREDTSMEVPKTVTRSLTRFSASKSNNTTDIFINKEKVFNSSEDIQEKITNTQVNDEEEKTNKTTLYSNEYSKEEIHFEDGAQQESEYTEHYDTATQRHLDSLTKDDVYTLRDEAVNHNSISENVANNIESTLNLLPVEKTRKCREAVAFAKVMSASHLSLKTTADEDIQLATPPRPGTIAEREHKKWENAPPIENNPYSEENIQRRLLERQYSRRPPDIPGIHNELPKSNGNDLEVVLEPSQPDIKRFGRDYYINHAKSLFGDKARKSPTTTSTSSRPDSALSQRSSSTWTDQEQQEESLEKDVGNDSAKSRRDKWQRNNSTSSVESNARSVSACTSDYIREEYSSNRNEEVSSIGRRKSWSDQRVEDLLENERKNSKNEINARLNNQDNNSGNLETKKPYVGDNQRKIRRIDLKAYGFENEFGSHNDRTVKSMAPQRVVNKLDLKSFGYDGGLRRTQSHNQIDSANLKPRIVRMANKSNLSRYKDHHNYHDRDIYDGHDSGDRNLTQSTEALNELCGQMNFNVFRPVTEAKSVPNIAKSDYYENAGTNPKELASEDDDDLSSLKKLPDLLRNYEAGNVDTRKNNGSSSASSEIDSEERDRSMEKLSYANKPDDCSEEKMNLRNIIENELPMPSVRRLAEAFNKPPSTLTTVPRSTQTSAALNERSPTPEVQIIETPRQMHSLTARSLSKQFREGLRQIPNRVTSPPASHVTMEQSNGHESQAEIVQIKMENSLKDVNVIAPGKLKSNIIFWEQMQRRN